MMQAFRYQRRKSGFTLAELLIALAILGVIATFTIPKVLSSQQDTRSKSIAKEVAGVISGAYQSYQATNGSNPNIGMQEIIDSSLNYVKQMSPGHQIDDVYTQDELTCFGTNPRCRLLHNGAVIRYHSGVNFGGTASTNAISFFVDPDGTYGGTPTGSGKSVQFFLYYDGKIRTKATIESCTKDSGGGCNNPQPLDPPWFSWD